MSAPNPSSDKMVALGRQYGCGPVELSGSADALYERHLFFDNVADPGAAGAHERYEALHDLTRATARTEPAMATTS